MSAEKLSATAVIPQQICVCVPREATHWDCCNKLSVLLSEKLLPGQRANETHANMLLPRRHIKTTRASFYIKSISPQSIACVSTRYFNSFLFCWVYVTNMAVLIILCARLHRRWHFALPDRMWGNHEIVGRVPKPWVAVQL